jgi:hypothetical protein
VVPNASNFGGFLTVAATYALRFIAGKYKGGQFPLRPNREIIVGRGSEFDMVLDEDMVSRRHAKLATYHGQIVLQDLKSTNGTFVNGERINVARLKVGDKILVGTSIMELLRLDEAVSHVTSSRVGQPPADPPSGPARSSPPQREAVESEPPVRPTIERGHGMSGRFPDDDVTVSDLIELFNGTQRNGVLVLTDDAGRDGRIFFREGEVYFATVADPIRAGESTLIDVAPGKSFVRLLQWTHGAFRMDNLNPPPSFQVEIEGNTRQLLVDAMRQIDELARYDGHLPAREQHLSLNLPLEARLSALSAEALDTLQVALNFRQVGLVLDQSPATDLETYQDLLYLIQNAYLSVT